MTGLFLVISLFWLLPAEYDTLDVPLESALLIRGEPVGFTRRPYRQKRSETESAKCEGDEYKPKKANHCCKKCLPGYMVAADCIQGGRTTNCTKCQPDYYNRSPSGSKSCKPCTDCLSQLDQVRLQACSPINDTVCGCPGGFYKSDNERKFTCVKCNPCENGSELSPCKADKDTLCKCFHNFYLDFTGKCRSCKECNRTEDCNVHCPPASELPEEPAVVPKIVAGVLGVALLAVVIFVIVKSRHWLFSSLQTKSPLPVTDPTGSSQLSTPLVNSSTKHCKSEFLPGHEICVVEDPELEHQNKAQNTSLPLPDITLQTKTQCLNNPQVVYKVIECIPVGNWREFIRRLGVSNHAIETAEQDYRHYKDAQYAMLSVWLHNAGSSGATRDILFNVLREMNLGGCVERIEESF